MLKIGLPFMRNVLEPSAKSVLIPLGLSQDCLRIGNNNANNIKWQIENTLKIVKFLEDSGLSIKGVTQTTEDETKEQKRWISWYDIR